MIACYGHIVLAPYKMQVAAATKPALNVSLYFNYFRRKSQLKLLRFSYGSFNAELPCNYFCTIF